MQKLAFLVWRQMRQLPLSLPQMVVMPTSCALGSSSRVLHRVLALRGARHARLSLDLVETVEESLHLHQTKTSRITVETQTPG
eukprot:1898634-Rhodomonas_salina.3